MIPKQVLWTLAIALVSATGCSAERSGHASAADTTSTLSGKIDVHFVHAGAPLYGSVVCLIEGNVTAAAWWSELLDTENPVVMPELDSRLRVVDRTVCSDGGDFTLENVKPGKYFVYARVLLAADRIRRDTSGWPVEPSFSGSAWGAATEVFAGRDTAIALWSSRSDRFKTAADRIGLIARRDSIPGGRPEFGTDTPVDVRPRPVTQVTPVYPDLALEAQIDGTVIVQVLVGADGRVRDARIVKSIPMLDSAAEIAARQWIFKPARRAGKPVAAWTPVPIRFALYPERP